MQRRVVIGAAGLVAASAILANAVITGSKATARNGEPPVARSTEPLGVYETAGDGRYHDIRYIRLNNTPNHAALHVKLAALENAEAALVAASGMAAITTALLAVLRPGGHILAQESLYGGTYDFLARDLAGFGMSHDFIDPTRPETWAAKLRPETRAVYVETISNPLMQVPALEAVASFAREHGLVSMIDNTFATPVNFRPATSTANSLPAAPFSQA